MVRESAMRRTLGGIAFVCLLLASCGVATDADVDRRADMGGQSSGDRPCESPADWAACLYVIDNVQTFWSPTELRPGVFRLAEWEREGGSSDPGLRPVAAFDDAHPGPGAMLAQFGSGDAETPKGQLAYYPPAGFSDMLRMSYYVTASDDSSDSSGCDGGRYVECVATGPDDPNADHATFTYTVTDFPLTVEVTNALLAGKNDRLLLVNDVDLGGFVPDPKGRSGNTDSIAPGDTAYLGLYQPAPSSGLGLATFEATYQVADTGTDLAGATFTIDVAVDAVTGKLADGYRGGGPLCSVDQDHAGKAGCDVSLVGEVGAPHTLYLNIHGPLAASATR